MKESKGRASTKFELILFFHSGYKPKEIIAKGYPNSTVYKYSKYYKNALKIFREKK